LDIAEGLWRALIIIHWRRAFTETLEENGERDEADEWFMCGWLLFVRESRVRTDHMMHWKVDKMCLPRSPRAFTARIAPTPQTA
jgi:hypothetical protein